MALPLPLPLSLLLTHPLLLLSVGDRGTGKSSLISYLRNAGSKKESARRSTTTSATSAAPSIGELALSYSYIDSLDDDSSDGIPSFCCCCSRIPGFLIPIPNLFFVRLAGEAGSVAV